VIYLVIRPTIAQWLQWWTSNYNYNYNIHLYSVALQCCPGHLTVLHTEKHKNRTVKKQYYSDDETVKQLGIRECSFEQDGLKRFFKFTDVGKQAGRAFQAAGPA